jgi:hypothetical protein
VDRIPEGPSAGLAEEYRSLLVSRSKYSWVASGRSRTLWGIGLVLAKAWSPRRIGFRPVQPADMVSQVQLRHGVGEAPPPVGDVAEQGAGKFCAAPLGAFTTAW